MAQHGEDEYVYEALSKLAVIKSADAGDKAEHSSKAGTRGAGWSNVNRRWSVCCSGRNGALKSSSKAVLAINHAADIALAILAECLSAGTAVGGCRLISVDGASHACRLLVDS